MIDLIIRNAKKADLQNCAKILMQEFRKQGQPWTIASATKRLTEIITENPELCFCLEFDGKVIGFMFCEQFNYVKGRCLWVVEFAIYSSHQRKGFGLQALKYIEQFAKEKGFNVLYLAANIKEKAFKIYEKFGFKKTNWFFMEKDLY